MGTTTLSPDDRYWAVPVKSGSTAKMIVLNTASLSSGTVLERDSIGHPQFHPEDSNWLRYAGPYDSRIWVMRRDGSENRLAYRRDAARKEWIVHETWRPGTREILTTNWPHGVMAIHADTGATRKVCSFNAWHPMVDPTGQWMVSDTKNPDRGLQLFHLGEGLAQPTQLCLTEATNAGDHWKHRSLPLRRRTHRGLRPLSTPIPTPTSPRMESACCLPPTEPAIPNSTRWKYPSRRRRANS